MSISTLNNEIKRLTNDIVTLQNRLAREKKNESDKRVKIANIKKTITKNYFSKYTFFKDEAV